VRSSSGAHMLQTPLGERSLGPGEQELVLLAASSLARRLAQCRETGFDYAVGASPVRPVHKRRLSRGQAFPIVAVVVIIIE
jgi:microcompartment protein CcmK/EutM